MGLRYPIIKDFDQDQGHKSKQAGLIVPFSLYEWARSYFSFLCVAQGDMYWTGLIIGEYETSPCHLAGARRQLLFSGCTQVRTNLLPDLVAFFFANFARSVIDDSSQYAHAGRVCLTWWRPPLQLPAAHVILSSRPIVSRTHLMSQAVPCRVSVTCCWLWASLWVSNKPV